MAFSFVWGTGFEMGNVPAQAGVCTQSGSVVVENEPKTGAYSARLGSSLFPGEVTIFLNDSSNISFGVWCKQYSLGGLFEIRITLTNDDVVSFVCDSSLQTWRYKIGANVVATGTIFINTYQYHNIQATLSTSAGVTQKINGVTSISYGTSLVSTIKSITFYGYGPAGGVGGWYDDIIVGTGTSFIGDIRFDVLKPNGDTATVNWMPNGFSLQSAPAAPTVGLSAGPGITGDYYYKITLVDTDGETLLGTSSALVQPSNQTVNITAIPTGEVGTSARKIYRTANGGSVFKLLTTINDNTTTTYDDTTADGSLGAERAAKINYDKIDETPASDSDFIHTATNGVQDLHTLEDWDSTKKTPLYLIHWARAIKNTAEGQQIKLLQKSLGTLKTGSAQSLATSSAYIFDMLSLDPAGNPWTDAAIDDLQVGGEAVIP